MQSSVRIAFLGAWLFTAGGCTTLGPMPATTGISMVPAARPEVELRASFTPGYYLSEAVREDPRGTSLSDVAAVLEPDRLLGVPGLFVGGRYAGAHDQGAGLEPALGYRTALGESKSLSVGVVGYGTHASAARNQASFEATRAGLELGGDLRLTPKSEWVELTWNASAALTGLTADGKYCLDTAGRFGVDCPDEMAVISSTHAGGVYPSVSTGLGLELGRHRASVFHGMRLGVGASGGTMPHVVAAEQASPRWFGMAGLSLSVALGAR